MTEELKLVITAAIGEAKSAINEVTQDVKKMGSETKKTSGSFKSGLKSCGKAAVKIGKVIATALVAAGTALVALSESTREYRTQQAQLATAFTNTGSTAEQATTTYNDLYRVLGDTGKATEAAQHLALITNNQKDLATWTNTCQGIYATFGDSLPIEGLTEAANETIKVGKVTGTLADALNWVNISEDEFNAKLAACATQEERSALVRDTLNSAYSDAAANYENTASSILRANEAQATLTQGLAAVGAVIEPIVAGFKMLAGTTLLALAPALNTLSQGISLLGTDATNAQSLVTEGFTNMFTSLLTIIAENLPKVMEMAVSLVGGLIQGIANAAPQVAQGLMSTITTFTSSLPTLLPLLLNAGIQLVVALAKGVGQSLPIIIQSIADTVPLIVSTLVAGLPDIIDGALQLLLGIVDAIPILLPFLINELPSIYETIITGLLNSLPQIWDAAFTLFMAICESIPAFLPQLALFLPKIKLTILKAIVSAMPSLYAKAIELFTKIPQAIPKIWNSLKSGLRDIVDKIKNALQFDWKLPKVKLPHFTASGKFSLNPPSTPKFKVSWYANGGVFDKKTLFPYGGNIGGLGEAGAEAIVPLEKNTQWLDRIAERLNGNKGGNIILQIDGKTFAQASIDSINSLTKQTGKLQLKLV